MSGLLQSTEDLFTTMFYHNPIYPACHDIKAAKDESMGRERWKHMFFYEKVNLAFENHEHMYKIGKRISFDEQDREVVDPKGTLFLGNGQWSVPTYPCPETTPMPWFVEKRDSFNHFWVLNLATKQARSVGLDGSVIDTVNV